MKGSKLYTAPPKKLRLKAEQIVRLVQDQGLCVASDKVTVDGFIVSYMYREAPDFENDSGWRFFSGKETQAYVNDPANAGIYDLNTIANYDRSIIKYLDLPVGTELERKPNSEKFIIVG